jgi:5'-methylthioadenosine phosphorylase
MHEKGTYINMEGAAFSTKAESYLYKSWGMDIIGMTNMPEAKLSREAEICYATLACVTDYDCWYMDEAVESVSIDLIIQNLRKNVAVSKSIVKEAVRKMPEGRGCLCAKALENAIVTARDKISPQVKKRLDIIIGRYVD